MKTLSYVYLGALLVAINLILIPTLISADDTLLVTLGFLTILTEIGLAANLVSKRLTGEEK